MAKSNLNGSVNLLADAMRKVFSEAVQGAVEPLRKDVKELREHVDQRIDETDKKIDEGLKTTNENVQAQIAQHRKDVAADVKKIVKGR